MATSLQHSLTPLGNHQDILHCNRTSSTDKQAGMVAADSQYPTGYQSPTVLTDLITNVGKQTRLFPIELSEYEWYASIDNYLPLVITFALMTVQSRLNKPNDSWTRAAYGLINALAGCTGLTFDPKRIPLVSTQMSIGQIHGKVTKLLSKAG